ncbi:MAG: trans-2-enoyl-CoA reductase family protein [Treponema sp.]|nr:trans-2-enoyl-CoA reductase family protein [Treponema sp.]
MIIKPMVRNNICLNSHPAGCRAVVMRQINYVRSSFGGAGITGAGSVGKNSPKEKNGPKLALVIGCSTGYGLASRIAAAFGYGAVTVGVSFEKPGSETKPGTPGFYNNLAFEKEAKKGGLVSITLDGDAFSDEVKKQTVEAIRKAAGEAGIEPRADLVIYSLASPVRTDPKTGIMHRSVIKPIGQRFSGKTVDMMSGNLIIAAAEPATEEEIANTVKVMGGEDWELWIDALVQADAISPDARTLAYTYIGPELSWAIYKNGTIGRAKEDLERAARAITAKYGSAGTGKIACARVSVNKALVTRASAVIPIIPFYVSCLFKVMKEKGIHEGCIEQIVRLYRDRLYTGEAPSDPAKIPVDSEGRIRIDDWEMRDDVQKETNERMDTATQENINTVTDIAGFRHDFLEAHGFDVAGVDYETDVNPSGL